VKKQIVAALLLLILLLPMLAGIRRIRKLPMRPSDRADGEEQE